MTVQGLLLFFLKAKQIKKRSQQQLNSESREEDRLVSNLADPRKQPQTAKRKGEK